MNSAPRASDPLGRLYSVAGLGQSRFSDPGLANMLDPHAAVGNQSPGNGGGDLFLRPAGGPGLVRGHLGSASTSTAMRETGSGGSDPRSKAAESLVVITILAGTAQVGTITLFGPRSVEAAVEASYDG